MIIHGDRGLLAPEATVVIRSAGGDLLAAGPADAEGGFRIAVPDEKVPAALEIGAEAAGGAGAREQTIVKVKMPAALLGLVAVVEVGRSRHFDTHGSGRHRSAAPSPDPEAPPGSPRLVSARVRFVFADGSVAGAPAR